MSAFIFALFADVFDTDSLFGSEFEAAVDEFE